MDRITIGQALTTQLEDLASVVELVDETGRPLGRFLPSAAIVTSDDCPHTAEELAAMQAEEGGRPLPEIWRSLGAK